MGDDEVTGSTTSGHFCQTIGTYTIYFALQFDRPFQSMGTWDAATVRPGASTCSATSSSGIRALLGNPVRGGGGCGAWVTFDTTHDPTVLARVGVSFTSITEAKANLAAELPGWDMDATEGQATTAWNDLLGRISVGGGTPAQQRVFYTALYHSLLHPNVFSDVDGSYPGFDGRCTVPAGTPSTRTSPHGTSTGPRSPLLALLAPGTTAT